jgi:protein arginine kinase
MVISTRARVARNLRGFPFSLKEKPEDKKKVEELVLGALKTIPTFKEMTYISIGELGELDRTFLLERHLVSIDLLKDGSHSGVAFRPDENLSVMVNEEDHLRLQSIRSGLNLDEVFEEILQASQELGRLLEFSFSEKYGYLTACPTNVGLGMRLSVLLHLPGVVYTKRVAQLFEKLRKRKVSVRGLYGEGSEIQGNIFQVSSRATLGVGEKELLVGFKETVEEVINFEKEARNTLLKEMKELVEDRIYRSLATLQNARVLTFRETAEHTSAVRLGVGLGMLLDIKTKTLNELLLFSQPAHLQKMLGKVMNSKERDIRRASYVRAKLKTG